MNEHQRADGREGGGDGAGGERSAPGKATLSQQLGGRSAPATAMGGEASPPPRCGSGSYLDELLARGGESGGGGRAAADPAEQQAAALEGSGQPLDAAIRVKMEKRFGKSFEAVRVHTDAEAAAMVEARGARAFTYKNHIAFAAGAYNPATPEGEALIAHELTHVAQVGATSDKAQAAPTSDAGGPHEAEADRNAQRAHRDAGAPAAPAGGGGELAAHLRGVGGGELDLPTAAAGEAAAARFGQRGGDGAYESSAHADPQRRHQCGGGGTKKGTTMSAVTITVTKPVVALSQRGSAEYKVQWSVGGGKNGWIIQHLTFAPAIKDSAGNATTANNTAMSYWEAWQVRNGDVYIGGSGDRHNADTFRTTSENANTKGRIDEIGKVAFIEDYDLDSSEWGTIPEAGSLPARRDAPAGWADGSAQDHTMRIDYDDVAKTPQTMVTNP